MTAPLVDTRTEEVAERSPLYRYESYWTFPRPYWSEVRKYNVSRDRKILAPALADGTLVGYGDDENRVHSTEGFTHGNWWQATSMAAVMGVVEDLDKGSGANAPLLARSTRHWDQMFISSFSNRKAGSWEGAFGYRAIYRLKPDAPDPDEVVRTLSGFYVPLFERLLARGIIAKYEIAREMVLGTTDARPQLQFVFLMPSAEGLDGFRAGLGAAIAENALLVPAFASMIANPRPQAAYVRSNATMTADSRPRTVSAARNVIYR